MGNFLPFLRRQSLNRGFFLALLALVTLLVKTTLEWRTRRELEENKRMLTLGGEA
jgi:ABC-type sulfate transport system permease subunit